MNIIFLENKIPESLKLNELIDDNIFLDLSINYLDDGYELTDLESYVYKKNNILVNEDFLNHITCCQNWFTVESERIYCDHSSILFRYSFENYYDQIEKLKKIKKELVRFYDIKSKYGLDFYFQYLGDNDCFDIIHIENDFFSKNELVENKQKIEEFILKVDWEDVGLNIFKNKREWEHLSKEDQYDWKARYFGFDKAYLRKK